MSDETIIADVGDLSLLREKRRKRPCLVQYSGPQLGKIYHLLQAEMTLGRSKDETIVIVDQSVSRQHAKLILKDDETVEVEDLGSSNGTFINNTQIKGKGLLKDSDLLQLGNIVLKFCASFNIDAMVQDRIYQMSVIDNVTKIFNRKYLMDTLEIEFKQAQNSKHPLSLIYYDLDHFKKVNDTYGHNAGDAVLYESAQLVKSIVRKDDILGRLGGEEFVIVLPDTDSKTAFELAERVRHALEMKTFELEIVSEGLKKRILYKQTISLGVAQYSAAMTKPEDLLEVADQKLYLSKNNGRNRVTI